jgi:holin-like protein
MSTRLSQDQKIVKPVEANSGSSRRSWIYLPVGFAVLVLALLSGEQIKRYLHVPVPGNVLGLFVLLLGFYLRLISPQLVEDAAKRLLFVLPALSIPLFVSAIIRGQLCSESGWAFLAAVLLATAGLWTFVGHLAQHLLRKSVQDE